MAARAPQGWVLYDGACGFCRRWIPFWAPTLRKRGLDIAPLQSAWVVERLGLPPEERLADLRLLLADGRTVQGADAYRFVLRRIGWALSVYLLSIAPGSRWVFDRAYRAFATHRHRISRACGLRPAGDGPGPAGSRPR